MREKKNQTIIDLIYRFEKEWEEVQTYLMSPFFLSY